MTKQEPVGTKPLIDVFLEDEDGIFEGGVSQKRYEAGRIFGDDILFPEAMEKVWGFSYGDSQAFFQTLPEREVLEELRDWGFILVPIPPASMSLEDIWKQKKQRMAWTMDTSDRVSGGSSERWFAFRKAPYPGSRNRRWKEGLIRADNLEGDYVPNLTEAMYCLISYLEIRNKYLWEGMWGRTSTVLNGVHIPVKAIDGIFTSSSLNVLTDWEVAGFGLMSARRICLAEV